MKKLILLCFIYVGLSSISSFAQKQIISKPSQYGVDFEASPTLTPARLPYLLKSQKSLDNVRLAGLVTEVCQKEGCWLKMTTDSKDMKEEVFVKMKDHAFLVPKDIAGKRVIVFGNVTKKEQSIKDQKHYLEDAGASKEKIAAITTPKTTYVLIASGVKVMD